MANYLWSAVFICSIVQLCTSLLLHKGTQEDTLEEALAYCSNLGIGYQLADPSLSHNNDDFKKERGFDAWLPYRRVVYDSFIWVDGTRAGNSIHSLADDVGFSCGVIDLENGHYDFLSCHERGSSFLCQVQDCQTCHSIQKSTFECQVLRNDCFTFHCGSGNWYRARETCKQQGADLAVIKNKVDISSFFRFWDPSYQSPCSTAWIGLYREEWQTHPGEEVNFSSWAEGEPGKSGDCSVISLDNNEFVWRAESCDEKHWFYCGRKGIAAPYFPTPASPTPGLPVGRKRSGKLDIYKVVGTVLFVGLFLVFLVVISTAIAAHNIDKIDPDGSKRIQIDSIPLIPKYKDKDLTQISTSGEKQSNEESRYHRLKRTHSDSDLVCLRRRSSTCQRLCTQK